MYPNSANLNINLQNESTETSLDKNSWIDGVVKKKEFNIVDIFDKGIVRAKFAVRLPESSNEILVTAWKKDYIEDRLSPWKKFLNKNVIPLLYTETLTDLNAELVYTIPPYCTLEQKINSQGFRAAKNTMFKIVDFILQAAQGLSYIHEEGYNHLNVKTSSFALFKDGTVKVDQLHFLNPMNSSTKRNGVLQSLCPPEIYYDPEISRKYSSKFDSWSLGIMMIELLTGSYLTKKLPKYVDSWCLDVYPVIFKILKKKKFERKVSKCFPKAREEINLKSLRYLIANVLTLHPKKRPTVQEIRDQLCNLTVKKNLGSYTGKPKIWKRKFYWTELMKETAKELLEAREDFNEKSMNLHKNALKTTEKTEHLTAKGVTQWKEDLTDDTYAALRREILKYYGPLILHIPEEDNESSKTFRQSQRNISIKNKGVSMRKKELIETEKEHDHNAKIEHVVKEDNESSETFPPSEINITMKNEGENVRKKEFLKTVKEFDHSIKVEEHRNQINWSLGGSILSKLFNFGDFTMKYVTDPWSPKNPGTYLNQLSNRLTE